MNSISKNTIAIIDSGIDYRNERLMKKTVMGLGIENGNIVNDFYDENGHGTKCAYTICKQSSNVDFLIIKVLDKNMNGESRNVIEALKFLEDTEVKLINLSLSTENQYFVNEYVRICSKLYDKGKIVVCSEDNSNHKKSYPACLEYVIGVKGNIYLKENEYWFNKEYDVQVVSSALPKLSMSLNQQFELFTGNSKATALFTGMLFNLLEKDTIKKPELILQENSNIHNWKEELNNQINYELKKPEGDYDLQFLEHIKKVICRSLDINADHYGLLNHYILFHHSIGLNPVNCFKLILDLEEEFQVNFNYDNINFFDMVSPYSLADLIDKELAYEIKKV